MSSVFDDMVSFVGAAQIFRLEMNLEPSQDFANWERREKQGRHVASFETSEHSFASTAFELHHFTSATEPSKRGGRQERRIGPLIEAGRTAGRSKAKDCADMDPVKYAGSGVFAQLRPAAAGLGGSDRPRRERCS